MTCTGFLCLALIAGVRFVCRRKPPRVESLPAATVLKPLCGLEPSLEANLESFFQQQYPEFEIIFGARYLSDPSLDLVRRLCQKYPSVPVRVVLTGEPDRPNAKVCSLRSMYAVARHEYLVICDSDVRVTPNYLREVVPPLLRKEVGLVTCLYRGVPSNGLWPRLEALGMSVEMTSGVLVADLLGGMKFALGPTMALRRDVLASIGGFGALADYCADDFVLGEQVYRLGLMVVLSQHVIEHTVINRTLRDSVIHQLRWMKSTRFSRPAGHASTLLTFAMPFGLLGLVAGFHLHDTLLGLGMLAAAYLNRVVMAMASGWNVVQDRESLRSCWLYPLRDLMGFALWMASYCGRQVIWRGETYLLQRGGRMVPVCRSGCAAASFHPSTTAEAESDAAGDPGRIGPGTAGANSGSPGTPTSGLPSGIARR